MAKYFNYFPTVFYTNSDTSTGLDTVTNIIARFSFESELKENTNIFYPYEIQDGDTPETIANKFYGSSERHWLVLMFNNIIDPQYDWPLDQRTLITYINEKYSDQGARHSPFLTGIRWAQDAGNVKAYYKTVTRLSSKPTKNQIVEKIEIDANTHTNLPVTTTTYTLQDGSRTTETITKTTLTYYDYEIELNDSKRRIKLLKPEYVTESGIMSELKKVLNR